MASPLPPAWNEIIKNNVPFYRLLSPALKKDLHGLIQVFIDEKTFEGCGGLTLNDEIKHRSFQAANSTRHPTEKRTGS